MKQPDIGPIYLRLAHALNLKARCDCSWCFLFTHYIYIVVVSMHIAQKALSGQNCNTHFVGTEDVNNAFLLYWNYHSCMTST